LWIKTGLPWIERTTSDLRSSSDGFCLSTHRKRHLSGKEHRRGAGLKPSGIRISKWNGMEKPQRKILGVVDGGIAQRTTASVV